MEPTAYAQVNLLLARLLEQIQATLGNKLVGLYLYGSLVWGDFDLQSSDVDLLATLTDDLTDAELERLRAMHAALVQEFPAWDDRIEVLYLSQELLRAFKSRTAPMGVISPGEPLHFVEATIDWLSNWYSVQERGVTLFGPPPATFIEAVTHAEFLLTVREYARTWRNYVVNTRSSRPYQSYAILTLCRAWFTLTHRRQASKIEAARWVQAQMPHNAGLIDEALGWRAAAGQPLEDHGATYDKTVRFVSMMADRIETIEIEGL